MHGGSKSLANACQHEKAEMARLEQPVPEILRTKGMGCSLEINCMDSIFKEVMSSISCRVITSLSGLLSWIVTREDVQLGKQNFPIIW